MMFDQLFDHTGIGLLRKPLKQATGMTDAQLLGVGALVAAPFVAPALMGGAGAAAASGGATGATTAAGAGQGGLLSSSSQYAGPASQVMNIAGQAHNMSQGQPMQAPQMQPTQGQGFAGLLSPTDQVDLKRRQQAQQMAVQGLLGGYRG